ncbi:hypothetical protein C5167_006567 [Papaver somniferum]|uniref:Uncharacterized protein n=1 Tax=Papaver somniferum TaxID=3469 RepID=A0A4Y7JGT9_PAPSO|nr:hypothetical protein C5167_006567 [Papaver somniferum]
MDRNKMNITLQPSQYISTSAVILQLLIREWKLDSVTRSQYLEHHQRRSVVEEKDERGAEVFGGPSSELKSACNSALMKLVGKILLKGDNITLMQTA